jgi:hypothetical protein
MFTISVKKNCYKMGNSVVVVWSFIPFFSWGREVRLFARKHQHHMKIELLVMSCTFLLPTYLHV